MEKAIEKSGGPDILHPDIVKVNGGKVLGACSSTVSTSTADEAISLLI
jgi:hypothetical protein